MTDCQDHQNPLKVLAVGVLMTIGYFFVAGLVIALMDAPIHQPPPKFRNRQTRRP